MGRILQIVLAIVLAVVVVALYGPFLIAVAVFGLGHLMFPVLLLIVFSILFGLLGADYGLPGLFWHDRLLTRMGAATAVTLLLALSGVLAFYTAKPTAKTLDTLLVRGPNPRRAGGGR